MESKGIVIIAGGSHYYGYCATNLCASLRYKDKSTPITLFHDGKAIEPSLNRILDLLNVDRRLLPESAYLVNGKPNFYRAKTQLYKITPYDATLYLDADTLWLGANSSESFFEGLEGVDFAMVNEGYIDLKTGERNTTKFYTYWADEDMIRKSYSGKLSDKLYQLRSELIYFRKADLVSKFFRKASKVYDTAQNEAELVAIDKVPDEYAFNLASSMTGLYPHKDKWNPVFWEFKERACRRYPVSDSVIINSFYAYSVGGNKLTPSQMKFYNDKTQAYYANHRFAVRPWRIVNKKDVLKERVKL